MYQDTNMSVYPKTVFGKKLKSGQSLYSHTGHALSGSTWFAGKGSKFRMQQQANVLGSKVQLQVTEPDSGRRGFVCYKSWADAEELFEDLTEEERHVFEMIVHGKPCKPYGDFDGVGGELPQDLQTNAEIRERAQVAATKVFLEDYKIILEEHNFVWLQSLNQDKLSQHMIIITHNPMYVFHSNHYTDPQGAKHLAIRMREVDPDLGRVIDMNVYTKDREMRMCGSSKFEKKQSVLELVDEAQYFEDSIITSIDKDFEFIEVPVTLPHSLRQNKAVKSPKDMSKLREGDNLDFAKSRMLELLHAKVHESAYYDPSHGREDAYDSCVGVKFNHSDRQDPCYTGHIHEGTQNLKCWIDSQNDVYAKCYSEKCKEKFFLGPLQSDSDVHLSRAVHVNMQYLDRIPHRKYSTQEVEDALKNNNSSVILNHMINQWMDPKGPKSFNIRSGCNSGKSTLMNAIAEEFFADKTIGIITYRQTLAYSTHSKVKDSVNYLDKEIDLTDRKKCRVVIIQIDSIGKLTKLANEIAVFNLLCLDETVSLFHHLSATTLQRSQWITEKFGHMLKVGGKVLTLDATWDLECYEFLESLNISQTLIVNDFRPAPRTFVFSEDIEAWKVEIIDDIRAGENVAIASMSTEMLSILEIALLELLPRDEVVIHRSKSSDDMKKGLVRINIVWRKRFVGWSPTVEAGCDFSEDWFTKQYVYICLGSTTPMGLLQMVNRVRKLQDMTVKVAVQKGISLGEAKAQKVTKEEQLQWIRWVDTKAGNKLPSSTVTTSDGRAFTLPTVSPLLHVWAHNSARTLNGETRFFHELKDILEEQGNRVQVQRQQAKGTQQGHRPQGKVLELLSTRDIDEKEFAGIHRRVVASEASEIDKLEHGKHLYKKAWGIDVLDKDWLDKHGVTPGSSSTELCMMLLDPSLISHEQDGPAKSIKQAQLSTIEEILHLFGWAHPFDTKTEVHVEQVLSDLLKTSLFKEFDNRIKLFNPRAKPGKSSWKASDVVKPLQTVFKSCGIELESTLVSRSQAKGQEGRKYMYKIEVNGAIELARLVNLKLRCVSAYFDDEIMNYLEEIGFGPYERLIQEHIGTRCDFLSDSDDDSL